MSDMPLRYKISSWNQLQGCMSNNSRKLSISVSNFILNDKLTGTRIQVMHSDFGVLFACVVNGAGNLITCPQHNAVYELTPSQILSELAKYGFDIQYNPESNLSGNQIQYLMTLNELHFDKIRVMNVWSKNTATGENEFATNIVAFMSILNPYWLNNDYSCSASEFADALTKGTAMNLTHISNTQKYNWSWLKGFVANIEDVLADNAEVKSCQ